MFSDIIYMMTRTILSLDPAAKAWLEERAAQEGVSMAEIMRRAITLLRERETTEREALIKSTAGIWKHGDGLEYQQKLRDEW